MSIAKEEADDNIGESVVHLIVDRLKNELEEHLAPSEQCCICLEDLSDVFVRTECFHFFHPVCLSAHVDHCRSMPVEVRTLGDCKY